MGTPRHIWTSTSIDGNFGEKNTLNFFGEEAILRRKIFNRRRMMEWRYHQAINQKWSEASLTKKPTVFSSGDVHDDLSVLSVVCAEKKVSNLRRGPRTPCGPWPCHISILR